MTNSKCSGYTKATGGPKQRQWIRDNIRGAAVMMDQAERARRDTEQYREKYNAERD